ncbi:MAG TPA: hypothetical protein VHT29_02875 [Solirubrobacteraceae bacterium]|jgi:hypothetical protein|nr:hypothetical protein [Solirubrobacteraceae bacterium]
MRSRALPHLAGSLAALGVLLALVVGGAASAYGAAEQPNWALRVDTFPTNISSSGGSITVLATDDGAEATNGSPVTITDVLPPGLEVSEIEANKQPVEEGLSCEHTARTVRCVYHGEEFGPGEYESLPLPGDNKAGLGVRITVVPEAGVTGTLAEPDVATVSGGGPAPVSAQRRLTVSDAESPFGLASPFSSITLDAAGQLDVQAGDHPNVDTTSFVMNTNLIEGLSPGEELRSRTSPAADVKNVAVQLPPGFVGNPQVTPTCPQYLLSPPGDGGGCPAASIIGTVAVSKVSPTNTWGFSGAQKGSATVKPLYNTVPEAGHPAQFEFIVENQVAALYANLVHTPAGYTVEVVSSEVPRLIHLAGVKVTFFGNPAAVDGVSSSGTPFFSDPADCTGGPLVTSMRMDSWQDPGTWISSSSVSPAPTGCTKLSFAPEFEGTTTSRQSGAPSGFVAVLKIPQREESSSYATPPLRGASVALPAGLTLSPASAGGLASCSDGQFDEAGTEVASCPEASLVGTVEVHTPILANRISGQVFVGAPECDPCNEADAREGRMVRLFVQLHSAEYGVTIKLEGRVSVDPASGRLTATFKDLPQQPFDELVFKFKEGQRAPLVTPESCGSYTSSVDLAPWSAPYTADALLSPSFSIGEGCGARGFAPGFTAGTTSNQADGFSPFVASFTRSDSDQGLSGLQVTTPPGLLALLSSVPQCGEAQANAGSCSSASQIGHTSVVAGPGSQPLTVPEEGQPQAPVYLTGPYKGAPFGLSVVVPAVAGPFNLGTVVVRAAISVNPSTGQATITSDPLPRILDGVPLQIRTVNVTVDRQGQGFIFNPTSCNPSVVSATLSSVQGTGVGLASPYQAAGCAGLPFKPKFSATVAAHSSKLSGASLDVRVSAKGGPQSGEGEANIRGVKVDLPIQLPSRTSTLNKACLAAVFAANPALCPKESDVGTATASTPVLASPLSGPAYLVSHGGAKFPDLEIVLQGEGVVLVLDGHTDIKKGITSSNFDTVPDAPVSSFELKLPTGRYSILTSYLPTKANFDFCGQSLKMPTEITAQNGHIVKETTTIGVSGCPKAKPVKKTSKKAKKK